LGNGEELLSIELLEEHARRLAALFARAYGPVLTIGVGNRNRDANLLGSADERVTVRSAGPRGWREAVEDLVSAEPAITC